MKRYYEVTEKSNLYKDYMNYLGNVKLVNDLVKDFTNKNNIESESYATDKTDLYIVPTENDMSKYKNVMSAYVDGLYKFKGNSKIAKAWKKTLEDSKLEVQRKPKVPIYFNSWSYRILSKLFSLDGKVYCSLELVDQDFDEVPEGMIEMKASEFYKIIEDNNNKVM
jgi:heat shock protein HspQ